MSTDWIPPGHLRNILIELKARRYRDPIQKLAYLRRTANKDHSSWKRQLAWHWKAPLFLLAFIFLGARVQTVTDVKAGLPTQKPKTPEISAVPVILGPAWLVEQGRDYEVYSDGLRSKTAF